jgi:hypothetical protein
MFHSVSGFAISCRENCDDHARIALVVIHDVANLGMVVPLVRRAESLAGVRSL